MILTGKNGEAMAPVAAMNGQSNRRSGRLIRTVAMAVLAGLTACTQSAPPVSVSRSVIGADESPLVFADIQDPPLHGTFYKLRTNNHRTNGVIGVWAGRDKYPHGRIVYTYLAPGYYYPGQQNVNDYLDDLKLGSTTEFIRGEDGHMVNALGRVSYRRFKADNSECVVFSQMFGATTQGTGNKVVSGHYCQPPQKPLDNTLVARIVKGIGVRGIAVPEQISNKVASRTATTLELPFTGSWANRYESLKGKFLVPDTGNPSAGKVFYALPGNNGDCIGKWQAHAGRSLGNDPAAGNWSAVCTNGLTVEGTYRIKGHSGTARGTDQDGYAVRITFVIPPSGQ